MKNKIDHNTIPTAEEFAILNQYDLGNYDEGGYLGINTKAFSEKLIQFTMIHIKAALEIASKAESDGTLGRMIYPDSILNAYPLENIK